MADDTITSERTIAAPAQAIFDLIADPARHPDIDGSGTVVASNGSADRLKLGSVFGMAMKLGAKYSTKSTIIEFEEGRAIAWQTAPVSRVLGLFVGGRIWRYELEPAGAGTLVKETWDIRQEKVKALVRPVQPKVKPNMDATLERIASLVEA